jgi:hypothetical protein
MKCQWRSGRGKNTHVRYLAEPQLQDLHARLAAYAVEEVELIPPKALAETQDIKALLR